MSVGRDAILAAVADLMPPKHPQCHTCRSPYRETLEELLETLTEEGIRLSWSKLLEAMVRLHPEYRSKTTALRNHLTDHAPELARKAGYLR